MNSKERVRQAMWTGFRDGADLPDRVPVFCQLAMGHYFLHSGLDPVDIWYRSEVFAEALIHMARRYGFDGILVNLPGRDPRFERHIDRMDRGEAETVIRWRDGSRSIVPLADNARHLLADEEARRPTFEEIDPEKLHYIEPWDTSAVTYPHVWGFEEEPRSFDDYFPEYHFRALEIVVERVGQTLSVHAEVFSPFSQLFELLGPEAALLALVDDPGKVQACLARLSAGAADLALRHAARGPDALLISSAYAGAGFISRSHYEEFVLPFERALIERVRGVYPDLPIYTHTCGSIGDRLDLMLLTGTNGFDTLDPPPLGTVDLADAKGMLAGRAFIKGNLDPVNTLLLGSPERVRNAARGRVRVGKPGGGYILSSACSVPPQTPPENIEVLAAVAEAEGGYD